MNQYRKTLEKIKARDDLVNKTYQRIEKEKERKYHKPHFYYLMAFGTCLILLLMIFPMNNSIKAATYISLDINPSIQLTVNENGDVTDIRSYNDEGMMISENIEYDGLNYLDVCREIISDKFSTYTENDGYLLISISNQDNKTDVYVKELEAIINEYYINGKVQSCDSHIINEADAADMSIGKYSQYLVLKEYDSTITTEKCKEMSMNEIHNEIASHHGSESHGTGHHNDHHD